MKLSESVLRYEERVVLALRELYGAHGYRPFRMSRFEEYDLYVRNKAFLVSDSVITFTDTDGKLMALKPDVTLSIVKNCRPRAGACEKLYYDENVFRVSEGTHAFREIRQAGLECIGSLDTATLAEVLSLAARSLALIDDGYILDVSHLGVAGALIDALGLSDEARAAVLSALGAKNPHGLLAALLEAGVEEADAAPLLSLIGAAGEPRAVIARLREALAAYPAATAALSRLSAVLSALGDGVRVRVDFSVTHDMQYYNGIVFCGFLPSVSTGVLAGGQYDRLVKKLGRAEGAVGFAVYLDRLDGRREEKEREEDTLLLYSENDEPLAVLRAAETLRRQGARVLLARSAEGYDGYRIATFREVDYE